MAIRKQVLVATSRKQKQGSRFLGRRLVQPSAARARYSRSPDLQSFFRCPGQVLRRAIQLQGILVLHSSKESGNVRPTSKQGKKVIVI